MFEAAEIGNAIDKKAYAEEAPRLRQDMLEVQRRLAEAKLSTIIIVSGVEGAGKSEVVNLLHEWMDARGMTTVALWEPSDEERERPFMWRFWRTLPPKGRIGIFFGSWYTAPIIDRVFGRITEAEFDADFERIVEFERMLTAENTLLIKIWFHIAKDVQKKRFHELEDDPKTAWRVSKMDWKFFKRYDDFREVSERALRRTSTAEAAWHIVEGTDTRYRNITTARLVRDMINARIDLLEKTAKREKVAPALPKPNAKNVLNQLDYKLKLDDKEFEKQFEKYQGKINRLSRRLREARKSVICAFEGPDAAGKGGAIRRITSSIDARLYQVMSVAAPTDEERAHPYLWRFWRQLPRLGRVTIYDRSWYGRVLVERVEGFAAEPEWQRAYAEINAFEEQLVQFGTILCKFWIAISADEQLRRFKDRQVTPFKQYKITEEDWRNRKKWEAYEAAACDMVARTSTELAPWTLVEGNDKNWARIKVMKTVARRMEEALDGE